MKIALRPILWIILALVIYMAFKAPGTLSAVLNNIGHVLDTFARGVTRFLHTGAGKS
jgi:spore maturation protein SpmB